jgi:hypothetical protein
VGNRFISQTYLKSTAMGRESFRKATFLQRSGRGVGYSSGNNSINRVPSQLRQLLFGSFDPPVGTSFLANIDGFGQVLACDAMTFQDCRQPR